METAEKDTLAFLTPDPGIHSVETKYSGRKSENRKKFQRQYSEECYRCGNNHNPKECKFKDSKCFKCQKIGHVAKKCHMKKKSEKSTLFVAKPDDETSDSSDSICSIFCTNEKDHSRRKLTVNITVGDEEVEFLIDTGSVRTIVGEAVYQRHLEHFKLTKTDTVLRSYTGDEIGLLGVCHVPVKYQDQEFVELPLLVAQGQRPSLLGRDWLSKIKLNWQEVFAVSMNEMETLRREYSDLFLPSTEPIKDFKAQIRLKEDGHPIFCKARTVPYAIKEQVEMELRKLVERGVLQKVKNSSWAAPVVVVPKADQSVRICGDYKMTVNRVISEEQYPLPNTDDMFASLAGGKKITKLDLSQAYSQLEFDRESQECLTINTHLGLFRYARLPYGVSSASAIFQSVMDQVLLGLDHVVCRIDDILITAADDTTHLNTLREVFRRLRKHNIKLKAEKCEFFADQVVYMGFLLDHNGVHPTEEKVKAINDAPRPTGVKELKAFLGLLNYYGAFLPNLSTELEESFNVCKKMITESKLLVFYDSKKPLRLSCDSSSYGVGAVISHVMKDGSERPIAFASRTLSETERRYAQIEKEALSLVFGVKKFHKYLFGRKFTLVTDHKPLLSILGPKKGVPPLAAARMQRWALILAAYQYDIQYKSSEQHSNCDSLSRLPLHETKQEDTEEGVFSLDMYLPISSQEIAMATRRDPILSRVYDFTLNGWPAHVEDSDLQPFFDRRNELTLEKGLLLWGMRVVIPDKFRGRLLLELHDEHLGMSRTKALARGYSKWLEVIPVKSTTSSNTIEKLRTWFASVGIPEEIVSDNGPQFTSSELQDFMKHSGVKHTLVPPYHPQSNGLAERGVQILKKALKRQDFDGHRWSLQQRLANFLLRYRITPHSTTGTSPAELFLKRQLRTRLSCIKPNLRESVEEKQQKMKEQHDGGQCKVREFQGGEQVQVKTTIPGQKWKGISGVIHRKLGPLTYLVRVGKGIRYCHVDHLLASSATMLEPELTPLPFDVELPSLKEPGMDRALVSPDETGKGTPEMVETQEKLADSVNKDTKVPDQTDAVPERRYPLRMRKPTKKLDL
ncbi:uncharacterized protein K02A2.6-like [Saccostrea cucullata]|uniref:uncharacterized protein K02A2.6-like n=1 Tax=Saccostrea cuccullata TaxID=36930 RepID=UPI002ED2C2A8